MSDHPMTVAFARGRQLLQQDREAFIAFAPELGIRKRIARQAFGSPRHIDVGLMTLEALEHRYFAGTVEPVMQIVQRLEETRR